MRALLDVNCLLALLDEDHGSHSRALLWWQSNRQAGWATCPLTQNGFARISSQRSYPSQRPLGVAIEQLMRLMTLPDHEFWPDDISITDASLFDPRLHPRPQPDHRRLPPGARSEERRPARHLRSRAAAQGRARRRGSPSGCRSEVKRSDSHTAAETPALISRMVTMRPLSLARRMCAGAGRSWAF